MVGAVVGASDVWSGVVGAVVGASVVWPGVVGPVVVSPAVVWPSVVGSAVEPYVKFSKDNSLSLQIFRFKIDNEIEIPNLCRYIEPGLGICMYHHRLSKHRNRLL